jgi:hypothetical protein
VKTAKALDFLSQLAKLRRNFAQELNDTHTKPEEKMYFQGKVDAYNDCIREYAQLESDIIELETSAPPDEFAVRDLHHSERTH